jgi:hypothetical protein
VVQRAEDVGSRSARYGAVRLRSDRATSSGGPVATIVPPSVPGAGAEIDDPVGTGNDVEVVLDHHDRVPGIDEPVQLAQQQLDVARVKPGRRLVEQVERVTATAALKLGRELDALRLAAGQLGCRLAESQVAQPDLAQRLEAAHRRRHVREEPCRLIDGHAEHVGDRLATHADLERLGLVSRAVARRARRVRAGQEQQLDRDEPLAAARLAAAAGDVEREPPGRVAAALRLVGRGEQLAHRVEHPGVGGEVRPRGAADRLLVDADQPVERLEAERVHARGGPLRTVLDLEVGVVAAPGSWPSQSPRRPRAPG